MEDAAEALKHLRENGADHDAERNGEPLARGTEIEIVSASTSRCELLKKLRAMFREGWRAGWDTVVDAEEVRRMLKELLKINPEYGWDAEVLDNQVAGDERCKHVNVLKRAAADLRTTLELLLVPRDLARERQIRRQIKNYVFLLRRRALRRLGPWAEGWVSEADAAAARLAEPLLSWQGQSALLQRALSVFDTASRLGGGVPHNDPEDSYTAGSEEGIAATIQSIRNLQPHAGRRQVLRHQEKRAVRLQLKRARQRVDWRSRTMDCGSKIFGLDWFAPPCPLLPPPSCPRSFFAPPLPTLSSPPRSLPPPWPGAPSPSSPSTLSLGVGLAGDVM